MPRDQDESVPGRSPQMPVESQSRGVESQSPPVPPPPMVYDQVATLLRGRGWVKGTPRSGEALCLVTAIDEAVGVGDATRTGTEASKLARAARIGANLRELVNVRNLAAWSDEPRRTLDEVLELLAHAALAFPGD